MAGDEGASSQIEDQAAIHFLVAVEVEVVERLLGVAELGLLFSPTPAASTIEHCLAVDAALISIKLTSKFATEVISSSRERLLAQAGSSARDTLPHTFSE